MKFNKLTLLSLALWLIVVAVFAWFFIRGNTAPGSDGRTAVVLAPAERDLILGEMRKLLGGTHDILDALNHNDMKGVAAAARGIGTASAVDVNPALMAKLPLEFKQFGMSVHGDMDNLAKAAESGKSAAEVQTMLTGTLSKCVACHSAWQLNASH